jgi:hypothetical protein
MLYNRVEHEHWVMPQTKSYNYDPSVFKVENPTCNKCHAGSLDFKLFEDLDGSGADWIQWYCKNDDCGYYINVEIL